jgi:solute carrier family 35 protein C2
MILTLLPLAILVDGVHIGTSELVFRAGSFQELLWTSAFILVASVMAFCLGTSEYLLVYHTSGLTLSVAGVLKEVIILTISTVYWEEDTLSPVNVVGMVVCVGGITLHVFFKILTAREEEEKKAVMSRGEAAVQLLPLSRSNHKFSREDSDSGDSISVYESRNL